MAFRRYLFFLMAKLTITCCMFFTGGSDAFSGSSVEREKDAVRRQLGYLPSNFIQVSAWKPGSYEPIAIKTYPLQGGAKRRQAKAEIEGPIRSPFPTLFWLTCPEISKAVADLERRGFVREFEKKITADPELASRLMKCHEDYAAARWNSLTEEDRHSLLNIESSSMERMRNMMQCSGISGTNFTAHCENDGTPYVPPIKCLHAHYAHYRSTQHSPCTQNPVGEMIHEQLFKDFAQLEL